MGVRNKEIQVQKPAQSLEHFQAKVASGDDLDTGILKQLLIAAGVVAALGIGWMGYGAWRTRAVERHEAALAELLLKVEGDGSAPVPAADVEKRMKEQLPHLERIAASAPASRKAVALGLVAAWKLQLQGNSQGLPMDPKDPWSRLREAQRLLGRGDGNAMVAVLEPLRGAATPQEPWGQLWWSTRMEANRLKGDRPQALKDLAEYKARFKQDADVALMDRLLTGI